jgi:hypothetical protein
MATPTLTPSQITDLTATTLRDLGKPRFTEIATPFQRLIAMRQLVRKNRVVFRSGTGFQWDVMISDNGSAANVGLAASDNLNIDDGGMALATADWRFTTANYGIIGQVISMNREPARIVDYIKTRRIRALISLAVLMENNYWGAPPAVTDVLTPWGINVWFPKAATQGFYGTVPSGYTTVGLNPTLVPNWASYTDEYVAVSLDDLVRKISRMALFTDFQPPVDGIPSFNTGDQPGWFGNYGVIRPLEELLMAQNSNLGVDIASQDGKTVILRTPLTWVPRLESDTTNPIYLIPWGDFKLFVLQDWWLKETHVPNYPGQHTVEGHFLDLAYQPVARNRRTGGVIALGTTYPG